MSPFSDDPRPSASAAGSKPTLETLLRVKRAERPDDAFWTDFERGFLQKQLAACIEPRPWWLGVALIGRRLAPLGLPVSAGAAALLALMVLRTATPFGHVSSPASFATTSVTTLASVPSPHIAPVVVLTKEQNDGTLVVSEGAIEPTTTLARSTVSASPAASESTGSVSPFPPLPVVAAFLELPAAAETASTPSQLTIAQNLEAIRAQEPELLASVAPAFASLEASASAADAPTEAEQVVNPRHARLLAFADESATPTGDLARVRERMAHRLAYDDRMNGDANRRFAAGDRFSLSF
jgi:hypothetical protein